ncbi:hypothetical protein MYX64_05205 [Nitrospinae bacterium AH_259_B05_G02_I21]|nr:hypothetical protein [Nitrospinae bacterium AH_259_B05_G02_I21]MDA2931684.1 hypothetical protein [Nitrospinae bacterium AH-259-F20]
MASNTPKNKMADLKYLIENELFITRPLISTDKFISYCKERGIRTSKQQLEQFENLGVFYPISRVRFPKIKTKIEYVDNGKSYRNLGELIEGEEWSGYIREKYEHFWFERGDAKDWLEQGLMWDPASQPFQAWETFKDENNYRYIENFYSIFQCYSLYNLIRFTRFELGAEWLVSYSDEDFEQLKRRASDWAKMAISHYQENGIRGEAAPALCQILSNRYFPKTQSDKRYIKLSCSTPYHEWDWDEYCRNWDAKSVLADIDISIDAVEQLHRLVTINARSVDPLKRWYELISFVSVEEKKKLHGNALLAQTLYSMEQMIRLFYEELTGTKLYPPDESPSWTKDKYYGDDVTQSELQYLEFLTNKYRLNPRPKLILVVEGHGEYEQFPRLSKELLGYSFEKLGIEVVNIRGVGNFTGRKKTDRYGALERFIDNYHNRQTIVFVVLDNEGDVQTIKRRLIQAPSKYYDRRTITKDEYINIWDKNIELDNFSCDEIAQAMTELASGIHTFEANEITECERCFTHKGGDTLQELFNEKTGEKLSKTKLLKILFGFIVSSPENEFDENGVSKRPVVQLIEKVIELATINHQPTTLDVWRRNQESGYLGEIIKHRN